MSEEIDHLWNLRELDEQLVGARAALKKFPEQRKALEARAVETKQDLAQLNGRIADAQKRRRELEKDAEVTVEQERKFAAQLPMVKKNEEYQALLHEISGSKTKRSDIETQVLMQMDAEESLVQQKPGVEKALKSAEADLAARAAEIDAAEKAAQGEVDAIEARRQAELAPLPPATRSRYERVFASKGGSAVVAILKGACGGCFRAQPPQLVQEARKRDRLITCEGCGRLLIWPPEGA